MKRHFNNMSVLEVARLINDEPCINRGEKESIASEYAAFAITKVGGEIYAESVNVELDILINAGAIFNKGVARRMLMMGFIDFLLSDI